MRGIWLALTKQQTRSTRPGLRNRLPLPFTKGWPWAFQVSDALPAPIPLWQAVWAAALPLFLPAGEVLGLISAPADSGAYNTLQVLYILCTPTCAWGLGVLSLQDYIYTSAEQAGVARTHIGHKKIASLASAWGKCLKQTHYAFCVYTMGLIWDVFMLKNIMYSLYTPCKVKFFWKFIFAFYHTDTATIYGQTCWIWIYLKMPIYPWLTPEVLEITNSPTLLMQLGARLEKV